MNVVLRMMLMVVYSWKLVAIYDYFQNTYEFCMSIEFKGNFLAFNYILAAGNMIAETLKTM